MSPSLLSDDDAFQPRNARSYPYFTRVLDVERALRPLSGLAPTVARPASFAATTLLSLAQDVDYSFRGLVDTSQGLPLWPIALLHRGSNAHVSFLRKPPVGPAGSEGPVSRSGLAGLPLDQVIAEWSRLSPLLSEDGYVSVNSSYRGAPWINKETGYPAPWRKEKHLKSLNACYVDLDIGRPDSEIEAQRIGWRRGLSMVLELALQGALPLPTMVSVSGRGLHLYWVLEGFAHLFYPHTLSRASLAHDLWFYKQVNKALARILEPVGADLGSFDAARVLRVPGTRHSANGSQTLFLLLEDSSLEPRQAVRRRWITSQVHSYALDRLAGFLGVITTEATPPLIRDPESVGGARPTGRSWRTQEVESGAEVVWTHPTLYAEVARRLAAPAEPSSTLPQAPTNDVVPGGVQAAVSVAGAESTDATTNAATDATLDATEVVEVVCRSPEQFYARVRRGHLGRKQLYTLRARDLELVERRGWKRGHRRSRLYLYAMMLRGAGHSPDEVLSCVKTMAQRCKPPYPSDGNDTPLPRLVGELFEEPLRFYRNSTLVSLLRVTPELARELGLRTIVPEDVALERKPPGGQRGQQQAARRAFIHKYLEEHGANKISCRKVQQALQQAGFVVSHETVNQDMRAVRTATMTATDVTETAGEP